MINTDETCCSYDKICIKYNFNMNGYICFIVCIGISPIFFTWTKLPNYYVARTLTEVNRSTLIQHLLPTVTQLLGCFIWRKPLCICWINLLTTNIVNGQNTQMTPRLNQGYTNFPKNLWFQKDEKKLCPHLGPKILGDTVGSTRLPAVSITPRGDNQRIKTDASYTTHNCIKINNL